MTNFKIFRKQIKNILQKIDIREENIYFSQTATGYYAEYKPFFSEASAADFFIYKGLTESVSLHAHGASLLPTIKHFESMTDFENYISNIGEALKD